MRRYYNTLDLAGMWEEYYSAIDQDGRLKWSSLWHFICSKTENAAQRYFLQWLLGPPNPVNEEMQSKYGSFAQPQDWKHKRDTGGWFSEENLRAHSASIRQKIDALEALQAAGNGIIINSLARIERLAQQLDKEFGGQFFVAGAAVTANRDRAMLYVRLHSQLLSMLERAQDLYAKSHGINFHDMTGFESLLAAQLLIKKQQGGMDESRSQKIIGQIVDMTLEKGVKYQVPLPDAMKSKILKSASADQDKRKLN